MPGQVPGMTVTIWTGQSLDELVSLNYKRWAKQIPLDLPTNLGRTSPPLHAVDSRNCRHESTNICLAGLANVTIAQISRLGALLQILLLDHGKAIRRRQFGVMIVAENAEAVFA
jgi:hypothetical protein